MSLIKEAITNGGRFVGNLLIKQVHVVLQITDYHIIQLYSKILVASLKLKMGRNS